MLMAITVDEEHGYPPPAVPSNPLLDWMKAHGLPLTRQVYLELNYPDGVPDPLPAEVEAEIPGELREAWEAP
jgi:hypothetical protein